MPRPPRISLEDALYYITSRCIYNQDIFKEESDYNAYFELLKKYKEQYKFKLYAYALLPSHFHLLLELPDQDQEDFKGGISEIMHGLNSSYTKYFNGKYGRKGHLFRDRFKTALVEKDSYLLKLTAYIHLNPQKLNLVFSAKDYPYTSYSLYINKEMPMQEFMQEERNIILNLLGQKTYEQFMQELIKAGDLDLHNALQKKGVLGGVEFQNRVRAEFINKESQDEKAGDNETKEPVKGPGLKVGTTILVVALVGLGLTLVAKFALKGNKGVILNEERAVTAKESKPVFLNLDKTSASVKVAEAQPVVRSTPKPQEALEGTIWQITLTPASGGAAQTDTLTFSQKKFISTNLEQKKFASSNYSIRNGESGKIIWETMQAAPTGIALWRADISSDGKMKGVLSLRKEGLAVQDFTFTGEYWRGK
ncbi:MAG: transposase [Candidatus Omnitrophica bacterium]|nr:transposase [Candidatus Omnitrophota bacterium]